MHRFTFHLLPAFAVFSTSVMAADPVPLANFDGPASPMVTFVVEPEKADLNGSPAGKFRNQGFKPVMRVKIPRDKITEVLAQTPVLSGKVRAEASENAAKFVKLSLVVQTDVDGTEVFEPVETFACNPLKEGWFSFDLSTAKTKSIPSLTELAEKYASGQGKMLVFAIIQQTPAGETSNVTYDDIQLESK